MPIPSDTMQLEDAESNQSGIIGPIRYVFSIGEIILKDTGRNLLNDAKVKKAFLERRGKDAGSHLEL